VPRRLHTASLSPGVVELDPVQAHHARHVLRLADGDAVEVFDDAGRVGAGVVVMPAGADGLAVRVDAVAEPPAAQPAWAVAAAVPKGERADWMVEKLSELGCDRFVPLLADRSVVQPKGTGKRDRWVRIATESAKQSRRAGVMRVAEPATLAAAMADADGATAAGRRPSGWFLDTGPAAVPIREALAAAAAAAASAGRLTLFVGPEGGWTPGEVDRMRAAGLTPVSLTRTILRVETAAVAAAACVACLWDAG
jgi:16S rRNA (uracil1498-N3)-methyltransferase